MRANLPTAKQGYKLREKICNFKKKINSIKIMNRDEKYLPDIITA